MTGRKLVNSHSPLPGSHTLLSIGYNVYVISKSIGSTELKCLQWVPLQAFMFGRPISLSVSNWSFLSPYRVWVHIRVYLMYAFYRHILTVVCVIPCALFYLPSHALRSQMFHQISIFFVPAIPKDLILNNGAFICYSRSQKGS